MPCTVGRVWQIATRVTPAEATVSENIYQLSTVNGILKIWEMQIWNEIHLPEIIELSPDRERQHPISQFHPIVCPIVIQIGHDGGQGYNHHVQSQ